MRRFAIAVLMLLAIVPLWAEEYLPVKPGQLKDAPQQYWARGIVFSDVLEERAGGDAIKLGDRKVYPFKTTGLGTMYIDEALRDALNQLNPGDPYIFAGTVYQKETGWFSKKRVFYVVANRVLPAINKPADLKQALKIAVNSLPAVNPYEDTFTTLRAILSDVQQQLVAYCASSNLPIDAVFAAGTEHENEPIKAVRTALFRYEDKTKMPVGEFTVRLLAAMTALGSGALDPIAPEPTPEPVVEVPAPEIVEPAAVVADAPAVAPAEEPAPATTIEEPMPTEAAPVPPAEDLLPTETAEPSEPEAMVEPASDPAPAQITESTAPAGDASPVADEAEDEIPEPPPAEVVPPNVDTPEQAQVPDAEPAPVALETADGMAAPVPLR